MFRISPKFGGFYAAGKPRGRLSSVISATIIFASLALLSACATNPVTGKQDLVFMSESQEIALGNQASQQIMQQYRRYDDPALQSYVNEVGQRLAAKSHRANLDFHFTVLDSTQINAFALPGGHIYITRGLMAYLNSEAELAAVLGHEIGHVTARHGVRQQSSHQAAGLGMGLLGVFFPGMNNAAISQVMNVAGAALLSGYGREHELESDRLGAEYLANVGYDPNAMLEVVRVLKNQEIFDQKLAALEGTAFDGKPIEEVLRSISDVPENSSAIFSLLLGDTILELMTARTYSDFWRNSLS